MFANRQVFSSVIKVWGGEGILDGMTGVCPWYLLSSVIEVCGGERIVEGITYVCHQAGSFLCNKGPGRCGNTRWHGWCLPPGRCCPD